MSRIITIPKAGTPGHIRENHDALALRLTREDLEALDRTFPPPTKRHPLEML